MLNHEKNGVWEEGKMKCSGSIIILSFGSNKTHLERAIWSFRTFFCQVGELSFVCKKHGGAITKGERILGVSVLVGKKRHRK